MTHPNFQTNGASLEDCHTNFFALMDLCGIKWRRLYVENIYGVDPLDDPVLLAYSKCLAADILCVWRRVPHQQQQRSSNGLVVDPQHHRFLDPVNSAPPPQQPSPPLVFKKELWIFWYGEEPDLNNILYPELSELEQGSWENGLSYECRTLLFKAIHNRIERSLLSKDYVRLGKWFVQPYDNPGKPIRNPHSMAFSFFIHGESTVCACIDVREPPPVRRLAHQHILNSQRSHQGTPVILCPYGQAGILTGQLFKECDPSTQKLLEEWQKFYPLDSKLGPGAGENLNDTIKMPDFVEVIVGGVKLRYPSCYVLVCDIDDSTQFASGLHSTSVSKGGGIINAISSSSLTPPTSPIDPGLLNMSSSKGNTSKIYSATGDFSCEHGGGLCWEKPSRRVVANARQDSIVCPISRVPSITSGDESSADTSWDFADPGQKLTCSCPRGRKSRQSGGVSNRVGSGHSSSGGSSVGTQGKKGDKGEKGEKQQLRHARSAIPFHRRSPVNDEVAAFDGDSIMRLQNSSIQLKSSGLSPGNLGSVPQLRTTPLEPPASVGSPASAAASPLVGSMRPPSVAANDLFLTSPSPLTASAAMSVGSASVDLDIVKTENLPVSESQEPQLTAPNHTLQDPPIKEEPRSVAEQQTASPFPNACAEPARPLGSAQAEGTNWPPSGPTNQVVQSQSTTATVVPQRTVQEPPVQLPPKRPILPMSNYEGLIDDEPTTASLYDYSTLQAWLQHPVKKFKPDIQMEVTPSDQSRSNCSDSLNLPSPVIKKEPLTPQPAMDVDMSSPKPADPYEFVDDFPTTVSMAGFKSKNEPNKDDEKPSNGIQPGGPSPADSQVTTAPPTPVSVNQPPTPGGTVGRETKNSVSLDPLGSPPTPKAQSKDTVSLLREKDLVVTLSDLDQLFDTSDDSNDDDDAAPSPPGSLRALGLLGEDGTPGKSSRSAGCIGILGPTELSRMFPTPPSLEQASPCGPVSGGDTGTSETGDGGFTSSRDRSEAYTGLDSPQESVMDWSYVYKPQLAAEFVSSAKYAPLNNLPSQTLPPVSLPNQCVYKPSWQYPMAVMEKPLTLSRIGGLPSVESMDRMHGSVYRSMEPSPATFVGSVEPRMPLSFELQSPASNASSYIKNVNSVDDSGVGGSNACAVGGTMHVPEANSLVVSLVLSDSVLNLFKDHNFNSCTMCVCHMNIKGSDVGLYLPDTIGPSEEPPSTKCTCGFSAVVNRIYAHQAGLFYEDEVEITGLRNETLEHRKQSLLVTTNVLNSCNPNHKEILDPMPPVVLDLLQRQYATLSSSSACTLFYKTNLTYRQIAHQNKSSYVPHPPPQNPVTSIMATISAVASGCSSDSCPPSTATRFPIALDVETFNNALEILDATEVAFQALELGRLVYDNIMCLKLDENLKYNVLHKWPFLPSNLSSNSGDLVRLLKALQPMLQDAIHRKQSTQFWEATTTATYNVSGPLTWRQFLKLAGRSTEDQCEPQPIPSVLVGYDKEWLAISPFAIKYWEKLLLEPYNNARDIAYIVVAPDNEYVLANVKTFFKELSCIYEVCKLGRHSPITKVLRDGVMRVGRKAAKNLADQPVDDWFNLIGESPVALKLKLYAQVCRHHLAPHLSTQPMDSTLLDQQPPPMNKPPEKVAPAASPMPPSTPDNVEKDRVPTPKPETSSEVLDGVNSSTNKDAPTPGPQNNIQDPHDQDEDHQTPAVVIYMVDPFTHGNDNPNMHRLASIGLLRCYAQMVRYLPEHMQNNIHLQIIPLESILEQTTEEDRPKHTAKLKSLAFAVYSQCRRTLVHQSTGRSLTGFGPAAGAEKFLKSKDERHLASYRMYSPPYILAPVKDKQTQLTESFGEHKEKATVLFCTYCLSEDQRWLLATCTDDRGEFMETCVINVDIPNRYRRKKASARKIGLQKVMDWLLGLMSQAVLPWRLVIGRFGRLGQGELRGWSNLLSRKMLLRYSKHLKESCKQCSYMGVQETPCILSACLVSLEADSALRVMADQFATPDELFGSSSNSCDLSTPQDASCTHILVFPTSATTQSTQATYQQDTIDLGTTFQEDDILSALDEEGHNMTDINDLFNWTEPTSGHSPEDSPRRNCNSRSGSPGLGIPGRQSPFQNGGFCGGGDDLTADPQEEAPQLLQQPLALGYYVSTAKTGPLPKWFWTSCGHLADACPAFLKSALHVHSPSLQQSQDDLFQQQPHLHSYHPLDSNLTTDVLRCVLEGYNALSWLVMDPVTHDRRSCLPLHVQVLMQMYYSMGAVV